MPKSERRDFITKTITGGFALLASATIYPVMKFISPPKTTEAVAASVMVGNVKNIAPGTGTAFRFGSKPGLLVRTPSGEFNAFISICTHLDCIVQFSAEKEGIWCACHGGFFDMYGNNVKGPPPAPLTKLKIDIQEDNIYVSKAE